MLAKMDARTSREGRDFSQMPGSFIDTGNSPSMPGSFIDIGNSPSMLRSLTDAEPPLRCCDLSRTRNLPVDAAISREGPGLSWTPEPPRRCRDLSRRPRSLVKARGSRGLLNLPVDAGISRGLLNLPVDAQLPREDLDPS